MQMDLDTVGTFVGGLVKKCESGLNSASRP